MKQMYALGIGRNTAVFLDLALTCGYTIAGLYHYNDERTGEEDHGYQIIGSFDDIWAMPSLQGMNFMLTMGDIKIRKALAERILSKGGTIPTLIHPSSVISRFAEVSEVGVAIFPFTFIQSNSKVADGSVILSHVNISHNVTVGKYCFIAGGAMIGAYTELEELVLIGQGATTISGKVSRIGRESCIGAMSLVTKSVAPSSVIAGIPAKPITPNS